LEKTPPGFKVIICYRESDKNPARKEQGSPFMTKSADLLPVVDYSRPTDSEKKMKARRKRVEKASKKATARVEDAAKALAEAAFKKTSSAPPPAGVTIN
jgi:hypothetical protein